MLHFYHQKARQRIFALRRPLLVKLMGHLLFHEVIALDAKSCRIDRLGVLVWWLWPKPIKIMGEMAVIEHQRVPKIRCTRRPINLSVSAIVIIIIEGMRQTVYIWIPRFRVLLEAMREQNVRA